LDPSSGKQDFFSESLPPLGRHLLRSYAEYQEPKGEQNPSPYPGPAWFTQGHLWVVMMYQMTALTQVGMAYAPTPLVQEVRKEESGGSSS
jgi:hypothetical protein